MLEERGTLTDSNTGTESTVYLTPKARIFLKLFAGLLISSPALILYFKSTEEQDIYTKLSSMGSNEIINLWATYLTMVYLSSLGNDCSLRNIAKQLAATIGSTLCSVPPSIATYTFTVGIELKRLLYAFGDLIGSVPLYYYSMIQLFDDYHKLVAIPHDIRYLIHDTFYSGDEARRRENQDIELARRALTADLKALERTMEQTDLSDLTLIGNILDAIPNTPEGQINFLIKKYPRSNSSSFWKTTPGKVISLTGGFIKLAIKIVLSGLLIFGALGYFCASETLFSKKPFNFKKAYAFASGLVTNILLFLLCRKGGWDLTETSWNYLSRCVEKRGFAPTTLSKVGFGGTLGLISQFLLVAASVSIAFKSGYTSRVLYRNECSWVNDSFIPPEIAEDTVDYSTIIFNSIYILMALTTFYTGLIYVFSNDNSPRKAYLDDLTAIDNILSNVKDMNEDEIQNARKAVCNSVDEETTHINGNGGGTIIGGCSTRRGQTYF